MATHSSVLAWRIPGMGEPGRLPSMGSHRVGHDWSDLAATAERVTGYLTSCDVIRVSRDVHLFQGAEVLCHSSYSEAPAKPSPVPETQTPHGKKTASSIPLAAAPGRPTHSPPQGQGIAAPKCLPYIATCGTPNRGATLTCLGPGHSTAC